MRTWTSSIVLTGLVLMTSPSFLLSADKVYKCTQDNGRVIYSDKICEGSSRELEIKNPETYMEKAQREARESRQRLNDRKYEAQSQEIARRQEREKRLAELASTCSKMADGYGISIGESKDQVLSNAMWSTPDSSSKNIGDRLVIEHLVYNCYPGKSVRLLFYNGKLQSIGS